MACRSLDLPPSPLPQPFSDGVPAITIHLDLCRGHHRLSVTRSSWLEFRNFTSRTPRTRARHLIRMPQ
jgi:hypothetical protein